MKIKATVTYTVQVEIEVDDRDLTLMNSDDRIALVRSSADQTISESYIDPEVVIHDL